jgi:hypothetical protein
MAGEAQPSYLVGKTLATGEWGHTSITPLWVPVLVFAHLYAAFWLYRAWRLNAPPAKKHVCWARTAFEEHISKRAADKSGGRTVPKVDVESQSPAPASPLTDGADCLVACSDGDGDGDGADAGAGARDTDGGRSLVGGRAAFGGCRSVPWAANGSARHAHATLIWAQGLLLA